MNKHYFLGSKFQSIQGKSSFQHRLVACCRGEHRLAWRAAGAGLPACSAAEGDGWIFSFLIHRCSDVFKAAEEGTSHVVAEIFDSRKFFNIVGK